MNEVLTSHLTLEAGLVDTNTRVNSILFLAMDTPIVRDSLAFFGTTVEKAGEANPIERINTAHEIARAVMFLSSVDASSLPGMHLNVTGPTLLVEGVSGR